MSSSESSEDDEETKKINEAVIPLDLFATLTSSLPQQHENRHSNNAETKSNKHNNEADGDGSRGRDMDSVNNAKTNGNDSGENSILLSLASKLSKFKRKDRQANTAPQMLNSNRPDKMKDNDHSSYHATSSGFRAHIEKRLHQILDSEMETGIRDSVWKKRITSKAMRQSGIKLFSDAKSLSLGDSDSEAKRCEDVNLRKSPPRIIPRKRKYDSNSSDSSDDEVKIDACIFSVDDIMHENRMLENLSKSGVEPSKKEVKEGVFVSNASNSEKDSEECLTANQKKKRKNANGSNASDNGLKVEDTVDNVVKVKAKKKKKKYLDHTHEGAEEMCDEPAIKTPSDSNKDKTKKRKKNKKNYENNDNEMSCLG